MTSCCASARSTASCTRHRRASGHAGAPSPSRATATERGSRRAMSATSAGARSEAVAMSAPGQRSRPKIVVLGMMTKMPVAGVVWQNLHYLLGFERLGYEAYYVETHARTPSMLMRHADDDSSALAAEFIAAVMRRFSLADRWA